MSVVMGTTSSPKQLYEGRTAQNIELEDIGTSTDRNSNKGDSGVNRPLLDKQALFINENKWDNKDLQLETPNSPEDPEPRDSAWMHFKPVMNQMNKVIQEKYRYKPKPVAKLSLQNKVYNFLERPTGWKCFIYHFTV